MTAVLPNMHTYSAFKQVLAYPMTWGEASTKYCMVRERAPDSTAAGYLVQYEDGYVSWCPKAAFERANVENGNYSFAHALQVMLQHKGATASLTSWNGKGMYVYWADSFVYEGVCLRGCFVLVRPDGTHQAGWLPSTHDLTTNEWFVEI